MSASFPTLIAIETSTELATVALLHRGELRSRGSSGVQTHSAMVLPMLQQLLADAGIAIEAIDVLAFGCGPGSFTGVRTACGLVQGLAIGAQCNVIPVVTLMAMAESARSAGAGDDIVAVLDARMGEVYRARYRHDGDWWRVVDEPALLSASDAAAVDGHAAVCGNGLTAYPDAFASLRALACLPAIMPHAEAIAILAAQAFERDEWVVARDAQPLYLRNKVALTTTERQELAAAKKAGIAA